MSENNMWQIEEELFAQGIVSVCGIDEAGRGPLAGPVCAAAVILPPHLEIPGLNDSKKLSEKKREQLFDEITEKAEFYAIRTATVAEIEEINILNGAMLAMKRAVEDLDCQPDYVLVDGNKTPDIAFKTEAVVKGDANGDGKVSVADARKLVVAIAKNDTQALLEAGDINGDGKISVADARKIVVAIAKNDFDF